MIAALTRGAPPLRREAWWLLIAIHIPFIAFTIAQAGFSLAFPAPGKYPTAALLLVLIAGAIQLRHSFAAAAGVRPPYWHWTLLLLVAIAYVPAQLFGGRWATLQWFVLASFAMLLRRRQALVIITLSFVVSSVWYLQYSNEWWETQTGVRWGVPYLTYSFFYWAALQFLGSGGLYGATRLVRLLDELREARSHLADLAIGRERLRISRDLHDLLGQSLSAVSLKGDLAVGLLERGDLPRARAEVESLVSVARSALHGVLDVAHHEPPIALAAELDRASDLLSSIGTETRLNIAAQSLSPPVEELFAWAVREGVTNVLRHSSATTCDISIARQNGAVRLEIVNDGAMPVSLGGSGLSGLAARAETLAGVASGHPIGDGQYRLTVEVPEPVT